MVAEESTRSRREGERDGNANGNGDPNIESMFAHTRTELTNLFDSLKRTAFVEWQGVRLRAVDAFFRGAFFLCILGFGLTVSIAAALRLASGLEHAAQAWSGHEWVGELVSGSVVIGVMVLGGFLIRARLRNHLVKKTEERLARASGPANETRS